jgi:hypothetical protein
MKYASSADESYTVSTFLLAITFIAILAAVFAIEMTSQT